MVEKRQTPWRRPERYLLGCFPRLFLGWNRRGFRHGCVSMAKAVHSYLHRLSGAKKALALTKQSIWGKVQRGKQRYAKTALPRFPRLRDGRTFLLRGGWKSSLSYSNTARARLAFLVAHHRQILRRKWPSLHVLMRPWSCLWTKATTIMQMHCGRSPRRRLAS